MMIRKKPPVVATSLTVAAAHLVAVVDHALSADLTKKAPDSPPVAAFTFLSSAPMHPGGVQACVDAITDELRRFGILGDDATVSSPGVGPTKV